MCTTYSVLINIISARGNILVRVKSMHYPGKMGKDKRDIKNSPLTVKIVLHMMDKPSQAYE